MERVLSPVEEVLPDIRAGKLVIVVDDEARENEGDFVLAAERATPEAINTMARVGGGLVCLSLAPERFDQLGLSLPVPNTSRMGTPFGVPIDARAVTTGTSAHERAMTARWAADPSKGPDDFLRPGHLYTLRAKEGGVLRRAGHTEASVDLVRLAGLFPAAVICEIMDRDGKMARLPRLLELAREMGIKITSVAEIIKYRLARETHLSVVLDEEAELPMGVFRVVALKDDITGLVHLALVKGEPGPEPALARVQRHCPLGDAMGALSCDCRDQMTSALSAIAREGRGVFVYVYPEPSQIPGLISEHLNPEGLTEGPDRVLREYGVGARILRHLGYRRLRLMTNNPKKLAGLAGFGLEVVERVPIPEPKRPQTSALLAKKRQLGHWIEEDRNEG